MANSQWIGRTSTVAALQVRHADLPREFLELPAQVRKQVRQRRHLRRSGRNRHRTQGDTWYALVLTQC